MESLQFRLSSAGCRGVHRYPAKTNSNTSLTLDAVNYLAAECVRLPADAMRTINVSIPIFLRNYTYCMLACHVPFSEEQYTKLFGKKDGHWSLITHLGGVYNYQINGTLRLIVHDLYASAMTYHRN